MDDDFGFGASVWDMPAESSTSKSLTKDKLPSDLSASEPNNDFLESFDDKDFDTPIQLSSEDDDFGDFGGFGEEIHVGTSSGLGLPMSFSDEEEPDPLGAVDWESLHLDPIPSIPILREQVENLLGPLWAHIDPSQFTNNEDIRQVEGLSQILVTPESRSLYNALFPPSPPTVRPPNWTRSRIRRQHLTSLGIPVNLDEVLPQANGRPLPALQITTRPSSAPPGPRNSIHGSRAVPASSSNSRAGTPKPDTPISARASQASVAEMTLGPKPELDEAGVSRVMALSPDTLPLLPLATLEAQLASMRSLTASTSTLLTHLLQTRDALQQDSETYNGLIAELVGEAQKMKTKSKTRTGSGKRGSGMA